MVCANLDVDNRAIDRLGPGQLGRLEETTHLSPREVARREAQRAIRVEPRSTYWRHGAARTPHTYTEPSSSSAAVPSSPQLS